MVKSTAPTKHFYANLTDSEVRTLLERPIPTGLCAHKWRIDGQHEHSCSKKVEHEKSWKAHLCLCGMVLP